MLSSYTAMGRALLIPLLLLLVAHFSVLYLQDMAPAYQPLLKVVPYAAILLSLALALLLNQGRVFCIGLLLLLCYWGLSRMHATAGSDPFQTAVLFSACGILLPFNLVLFSHLQERGVVGLHGVARLSLILLQLGLVAWVIVAKRIDILLLVNQEFLPLRIEGLRLPQSALAVLALALVLQLWQLWRAQSVLSGGLLLVLLAVAVACNWMQTPAAVEAFITAAALILAISLVLHTHHMAYRDELTGLPGRRALNERLAALGRHYTIAMLDIDHFKKFNDTYGHDVGDQVLKMVAGQIRRVGGGGKAFRYGGEEFTVVFPGKNEKHARSQLEKVRESVADYQLVLRGKDRPNSGKTGRGKRSQSRRQRSVGVTISIGMASRNQNLRDPAAVIKAADQALYRAKKAGRNCLAS